MVRKITDPISKVTIPMQYNSYYQLLVQNIHNLKNCDILIMTAFLGYRKGRQTHIDDITDKNVKRTEIRAEYLDEYQSWIYLILNHITEGQLFKDYENESENFGRLMNGPFLDYANAGMDLLIENVLSDYIDDNGAVKVNIYHLEERVMQYLWDEIHDVPF